MKRFQVANHACLMIKYAKDVRYDTNNVATHDKSALSSLTQCLLLGSLCLFAVQASDFSCFSH